MNKHVKKARDFINHAYSNNKYVQNLLNQFPCADDCDIHADKVGMNLRYAIKELNKIL